MKRILFIFILCLLYRNTIGQITLETFFSKIRKFVAADYTKSDLKIYRNWSDSSYVINDKRKKIRQVWFRGILKTEEGVFINFSFGSSELKKTNEKLVGGQISISSNGDCKSAQVCSSLGLISKYSMDFDSVNTISGYKCNCEKLDLHFYNYNPQTNKIIESIDTSLTKLLKQEYFDFYFTELSQSSSTWQKQFKTFMQPYSKGLIELVKKNDIQGVFDLINLNNKGYSWILAEGLWYYDSIYKNLSLNQQKILNSYNGNNGMIFFRSSEVLEQIYDF